AFGAFVDIGVHQDGLVHISALSERYVKDPREVVKAGDIVKVKVLEVDVARKRISLTMKLDAAPARKDGPRENRYEPSRGGPRGGYAGGQGGHGGGQRQPEPAGAMASAFAKLQGLNRR
ncbi:MAG: S1 RNA-binding domain-containing protein, partial [Hydrogenophaga sp.]|nr:S1 RNA-binding domain-containing protein [Hydrogenophaga sp.]